MGAHKPYGFYERFVKRPQDFLCAALAIIVLSPILLIVAFLVRINLGAPVLFVQERPSRDGLLFKLYKFRTMKVVPEGAVSLSQDAARLALFASFCHVYSTLIGATKKRESSLEVRVDRFVFAHFATKIWSLCFLSPLLERSP